MRKRKVHKRHISFARKRASLYPKRGYAKTKVFKGMTALSIT